MSDRSNFDRLLDGLEWKQLTDGEVLPPEKDELPYATHQGILDIGGHKLRVFRLSDGQAVIDENDFWTFFGDMEKWSTQARALAERLNKGDK